jgi:hypothetical protein
VSCILLDKEVKVQGSRRGAQLSCQGNPQKIDSSTRGDAGSGQWESGECRRVTGTVKCQTGRTKDKFDMQDFNRNLCMFKLINYRKRYCRLMDCHTVFSDMCVYQSDRGTISLHVNERKQKTGTLRSSRLKKPVRWGSEGSSPLHKNILFNFGLCRNFEAYI